MATGQCETGVNTISAGKARANFGSLLARVAAGETLIITMRGTPVARIEPIPNSTADALAAIEEWRRFRREHNLTLGGIPIRELIEDGRE